MLKLRTFSLFLYIFLRIIKKNIYIVKIKCFHDSCKYRKKCVTLYSKYNRLWQEVIDMINHTPTGI